MEATAEDVKARWGKRLQAKREEAGETQVQLAARLGYFPQTISRVERGQGSLDSFLIVAKALDVELLGDQS